MNIAELINNKNKNKNTDSAAGDFMYSAVTRGQQDILKIKDVDKYVNKGITPVAGENLDEYLPETQSSLTKIGNGLVQTVSELTLGTVKGMSDMVDLIGNAIMKNNGDYSNPVSQLMENWQEAIKEKAPVYVDPNLNVANGGLTDWGWIASNMPSIMSSLTLLIPGMALTKGIGAVAKAFNVAGYTKKAIAVVTKAQKAIDEGRQLSKFQAFANGDKLAKTTNLLLENIATATVSRSIENYQEGRQVYNDMYVQASEHFQDDKNFNDFVIRNKDELKEKGVDINSRDEVAKYVANKSADETFKLDYLNTAFDVIQLYALKNAWKTIRNAPNTSRKIFKANEQAAKEIGRTPEEIAKLNEGFGKLAKIKESTLNKITGSAKIIGAELSEGVEEAVNYIAQQEGMTFGNILLTGEGVYSDFWDRVTNGFDGRLNSYINNPQLWDSAFWGVVGGVVFQRGGSMAKRAYSTFMEKAADKETTEVSKEKKPWYYISELPEVKRRIEDIRYRNAQYNTYLDNLKKIDKGIDIFQPEALQQEGVITSDAVKEAARTRAYNDYVRNITMSAINNGNYDLLKAYLQDDNVRQGMIESGLFNEEGKSAAKIETESKEFIENTINKMDEVANRYERELVAINNLTLSKKFKGRVPSEIISIIASDNLIYQDAIAQQNDAIARLNTQIAEIKAQIIIDPEKSQLDNTVDYENAMRINIAGQQLGYLRNQRKKISQQPDSIGKRIALANIDKQIDGIEKDLNDVELYYATGLSLRQKENENGEVNFVTTDEFIEFYHSIILASPTAQQNGKTKFEKIDAELLKLPIRALTPLNETSLQEYRLKEQDTESFIKDIQDNYPQLSEAYEAKILAEYQKNQYAANVAKDVDSVAKAVGEINNTLKGARNTVIRNKEKIINGIYKEHGQIIRDIVKAEYSGDTKSLKSLYGQLDSKTVTTLKDVFKVFDFTKTYNQDIALDIEKGFDLMDKVEAAQRKKQEENGEVENTTNQQANTSTQNQQPTNPISQPENASTEQQTTSQNQPAQPTAPQQSAQPAPQNAPAPTQPNASSTPTQTPQTQPQQQIRGNLGIQSVTIQLRNGNNSRSYSSGFELNRNDNGIIEIVDEQLGNLNNKDVFDSEGIDLTRPHIVEKRPIVELKDGKYNLIEKGKIINTDTLEYQQRQAQQQASQSQQNPSTGVRGNQAASQSVEGGQRADVPLTQDYDTPTDNDSNPDLEEDLASQIHQEADAEDKLRSFIAPIFLNNKNADIDTLFDMAVTHFVKQGADKSFYESRRKAVTSLFKRLQQPKTDKLNSSTDELIIQTTKWVKDVTGAVSLDYAAAADRMIDAYCSEFGIPEVDGKRYINFEDLLRYLDSFSKNYFTSSILYSSLNEYLKTDEARAKYVRTDELGDNIDQARANIRKSAKSRTQEIIDDSAPRRINLNPDAISDEEGLAEEMEAAFRDIQNGDKLIYETRDNKVIFKDSKGRIIGSNTLPVINTTTGVRTMIVNNFIYDLDKTSDGTIKSKLKDLITKWFTDNSNEVVDLRNILLALTYDKTFTKDQRNYYRARFINHPQVVQAINDGIISDIVQDEEVGTFQADRLISHLGNLFKFRNTENIFNEEKLIDMLEEWFEKVYDNYSAAIYLSEHPGLEIEASGISDGIIIKNAKEVSKKDTLPADKAIAGGINLEVNKVAVTNKRRETIVSGDVPVYMSFETGRTHVTIPNRNGTKEYVKAFPSTSKDKFISKDAKEIVKELRKHLKKLFANYAKNKNLENFNALKDFITAAFDYKDHACLFYGIHGFVDYTNKNNDVVVLTKTIGNKTYKIRVNFGEDTIDVFRPEYPVVAIDKGNYNKKKVPLNDKAITDTLKIILDEIEFNIANEQLVNSDNHSEDANIKGIADKRNNKFTIKIGNKTWQYDSFNEYVLTNNLLSLNTHPNEDGTSNFEKNKMSSLNYNILPGQIEQEKTSTPVEEHDTTQLPELPPSLSKVDRVKGILDGSIPVEHKGLAIYEVFAEDKGILSKNDIDTLKSLKRLGLLPDNIIFDELFNGVQLDDNNNPIKDKNGNVVINNNNAKSNIITGEVTIGNKWITLFDDETKRSYAIRILIHEQLHLKLHSNGNEGYIKSISDIFDEFQQSLTKENVLKYLKYLKAKDTLPEGIKVDEAGVTAMLDHLNSFKYEQYGEDTDRRLEEFLVDSLMNGDLVEYLNTVEAKVKGKGGRRNLFRQILDFLSDLFRWDVVKGSLREKELYAIRNIVEKDKVNAKPKQTRKVKKKELAIQPSIPGIFEEDSSNIPVQNEEKTKEESQDSTEVPTEEIKEDEVKLPESSVADNDTLDDSILNDDGGFNFDDNEIINLEQADELDDTRDSSTDELIAPYTPEMQSIKQQSIADGSYMKASNGNPTNLNERQWLQVRTKAFKDWFGDWINNPSEASKVVDENGTEFIVFNSNQIKSATSNTGEFSSENDDIRYSSTDELAISQVKEDCQKFLDNFGIDINSTSISEVTDRFDKVNRLINATTEEEITDGVGEAVAFMMQYSRQFNELLTLKNINTPLQYKGVRRASKNNSEIHIESKFTEEQRQDGIKEIGKDIAIELRRRYNIKEKESSNTTSIMQKIKELINKFFELFTPNIKNQFRVINNNIRNIVDNIILNDPTVINSNNIKPGTFGRESVIVDYEKALKENPYEENIISILNNYDITLAGSASMAVFGTVYRPSENPMHDIDFNAQGKTSTEIENILEKEFKNVYNTNTIMQGEGHTETYLILDRPFKVQHTKNDGTFILDANTGEYLGKYIYSNLKLANGVKGKMLDFFLGNTSPYGTRTATLNGKEYKFTDPRNAILAKVTWSRRKDIFDYNRFISKEQKEKLDKQKKERTKEIVDRIKRSNIIWASPTIGKTTYIKDHKNEIIEWDEEVNSKRNAFIKEQIDPNNIMTKDEYNIAKSEYMANINEHPEYVDFITKAWNSLKEKAKRENKKIFASPLPLLKLFPNDFDLIINSNENAFFKRNISRGGKEYSTRRWKQDINNVLTNLNKDKIVTTDLYFSDLMTNANKDNNIYNSSTEELIINTASSFLDAQSQLPIELRSNFADAVASAAIQSQCR